ncbi:recombinase family protein [Bacillus sp. ISL-37]|uniref:recombinase family protein n=1 Tax=Bacillus sp. ISL-37 TaxID=2819123 RepID=UPI001BE974BD|nr:recombinase family protein [Bacillus sp. ISL-37]MBT2683369.1 recombinase family protein [Bacillus sp. ISL-37]
MGSKRALGYVRISPRPEKDQQNTSIEKQREEIIKYCEMNNIDLVDIYEDNLKSGKSFEGRDGFKKMFNRAINKQEKIDYIVVYKQDRLARKNLHTLYVMEKLNSLDKHLIFVADRTSTEDPKDKLILQIMSVFAELERELISFRTTSGMEKKAEKGEFLGGKVTGYTSKDKELTLIPEEAKLVRYIFKKYANELWGYRKIASSLNTQGIKTKNGKEWTSNAVKTILENEMYIGNTKWRRKISKGKHTPIIEMPLWEEKVNIMDIRSFIPEKIYPGSYPLSGLLKCPQCGTSMVQGNSGQKYKYYQCNKNKNSGSSSCSSNLVKKEYAEEYVLEDFLQRLKKRVSPLAIYSATQSILDYELNPLEVEASNLKKQIEKLQRQILKIMEHSSDPELNLDANMVKSQLTEKQDEINKIKTVLDDITKQIGLKQNESIMDIIEFSIENFEDFYHTLSDEEKKIFFHSVIKEVYVTRGKRTKDRLIKDIIYQFDLEDLNNLVK